MTGDSTGPGPGAATEVPTALQEDELVLHGRIMPASNATFVGQVGEVRVVYKPVAGERPLWDFPTGTLAEREVATYLLDRSTGWDLVPLTWLRDGPHGPGMVQRWYEPDDAQQPVRVVPEDETPPGWCHVADGLDEHDDPVALVHERSTALRRLVVLDVIVNNGDRKGGHVLAGGDGARFGVDHGVSFNTDDKLRTVLWGWAGETLTAEERDVVVSVRQELDSGLGERLATLLTTEEVHAARRRCELLLERDRLPHPSGEWPAIPWPPF